MAVPSKRDLLMAVSNRFTSAGIIPLVASEMEFYISGGDPKHDEQLLNGTIRTCHERGLPVEKWLRETGERQYEIIFPPAPDPLSAASCAAMLKLIALSLAKEDNLTPLFAAKPYGNQPGCGFHVHVSLHDQEGHNLFHKVDEETDSDTLLYSVGGLCATMREAMIFFAPHEESYLRFTAQRNAGGVNQDNPLRAYNNAPVNVSWGGNNRTTAIRIPSHTSMPERRRLEHRVAGADADPYLSIAAILAGIHYGITNKIKPPSKIHGNAFDKRYDLPSLPLSMAEAEKAYREGLSGLPSILTWPL